MLTLEPSMQLEAGFMLPPNLNRRIQRRAQFVPHAVCLIATPEGLSIRPRIVPAPRLDAVAR
jgi:hypothetical protein